MSNVRLAVQTRENTAKNNFKLSFCNRPWDLDWDFLFERGLIWEVLLSEVFTLLKIYFAKQVIFKVGQAAKVELSHTKI